MSNYRTWFISDVDGNRDDVGEAAYAFALAREAEGFSTVTLETQITADSSELSVEWFVPSSAWEKVYNGGGTADGNTVHAVFAEHAATVAAKVLELSVGHADNGRKSEFAHLPGWMFYECVNVVTARYKPGEYPYVGHSWQVPIVRWNDPAWGGDGKVEYSAYTCWPQGACAYCGGKIVHGYCQTCGAQ